MTVRKLPEFKGYVVDERLREFRRMTYGEPVEFIPFDSDKGGHLLKEYSMKKPLSDLFEEACNAMGGEYEEEYGILEPDVGGMFLDVHEAKKQWYLA